MEKVTWEQRKDFFLMSTLDSLVSLIGHFLLYKAPRCKMKSLITK